MSQLKGSQNVNRLAKYLKKHIDGAYKMSFSPNTADVYITMYYQQPGKAETFQTLNIDVNLTTYADKVRVNVITQDDMEKTLGQFILKPSELEDLGAARVKIWKKICQCLMKEYSEYDFVF